jgi:tetratricopeptide (TPR) repeat protein
MLDSEHKTIKLIDFGLALATDVTRHTELGAVFGTIAYMAPEQLKGENDAIGPWTDVYALGVTLFELLTLSLPYDGATPQAYAHSVLHEQARSVKTLVRGVSGDLQTVIEKALEKEPRDRYPDAGALALDLENVLEYRPINARPVSRLGRLARWARRKPMHAALTATLIVAAPTIGALGWRAVQQAALARQAALAADLRELTWLMTQSTRQLQAHEKANQLLAQDPDNIEALRLRAIAAAHLAERESGPAQRQRLAALYADIDALQARVPLETWPERFRSYVREQFEPGYVAPKIAAPESSSAPVDLFYDALLVAEHDKARAVELMSELIAKSPRGQQLTLVRAFWYTELKRYDDAQVDYRVAAALDPENPYAALGLGRLFTLTQRFNEAEREYRRALELAPHSGPALQGLADNALAQGRAAATPEAAKPIFARALDYSRRALAADPNLPWAHLNVGASLIESARLDPSAGVQPIEEAIEHYRAARDLLAKNPDADQEGESAGVIQNLCDAELQARRLDAALATCRQAVEVAPESATAHYNLAGAFALTGDFERALDELEKNVALGDRDADYLSRDAWFAPLRNNSRFRQLIARMRAGS